MLEEKMKEYGSTAWLVNTGWSGGKYGVGKRMDLKITRSIIDAIHSGELNNAEMENFPVFNM
jgi:phosphoenolpyruvate carboxykinase (ATP)